MAVSPLDQIGMQRVRLDVRETVGRPSQVGRAELVLSAHLRSFGRTRADSFILHAAPNETFSRHSLLAEG